MENNELNNISSNAFTSDEVNKEQIEINEMSEKIEKESFSNRINNEMKMVLEEFKEADESAFEKMPSLDEYSFKNYFLPFFLGFSDGKYTNDNGETIEITINDWFSISGGPNRRVKIYSNPTPENRYKSEYLFQVPELTNFNSLNTNIFFKDEKDKVIYRLDTVMELYKNSPNKNEARNVLMYNAEKIIENTDENERRDYINDWSYIFNRYKDFLINYQKQNKEEVKEETTSDDLDISWDDFIIK